MFNINENFFFLFGFLFMIFFSIYFLKNLEKKKHYTNAFLVTIITAFSYLILLDGSFVVLSENRQAIYYTRWLFYILSCGLLMSTIIKVLKIKTEKIIPIILLNTLVMMSGTISAILFSGYKWMVFLFGCIFFMVQIIMIFEKKAMDKNAKLVSNYIIFGWSIFPLVFIFTPEGIGLISNTIAAGFYLILDIYSKILFYFHINSTKKI